MKPDRQYIEHRFDCCIPASPTNRRASTREYSPGYSCTHERRVYFLLPKKEKEEEKERKKRAGGKQRKIKEK